MSSIVTFYSYKGGVGRSMALANIAFELARKGKKVLMIDWDLEAPGLEKYFINYSIDNSGLGLLSLLLDGEKKRDLDYKKYLWKIRIDPSSSIAFLHSGREKDPNNYSSNLEKFDWEGFFKEKKGGVFLERLRHEWKKDFDLILIDSRTGLSDTSGICTIFLPDIIIPMFTANHQSLYGVKDIMRYVQAARQRLATDRMGLTIFPIPTRFGTRVEFKESQEWLDRFAEALKEFYSDWLPKWIEPKYILEQVKIPQVDYFSFGEKLAVAEHGTSDPEGMGFIYARIASLLASDFEDLNSFIGRDYYEVKKKEYENQEKNSKSIIIDEKYEYDLFISHSHDGITNQWVTEFLPILTEYLSEELNYTPKIYSDLKELYAGQALDDSIAIALQNSKILIPILSNDYFKGNFKDFELGVFLRRAQSSKNCIIFPLLISDLKIEPAFLNSIKDYQISDFSEFNLEEIRKRTKLKVLFAQKVEKLANSIAENIKKINSKNENPLAEIVKKNKKYVREEIKLLANEYEEIRKVMPGGNKRTKQMEFITSKMKSISSILKPALPTLTKSELPGERLAAIAFLQEEPSIDYLDWLANHVGDAEKPFIGYQATVALYLAARSLGAKNKEQVLSCVNKALENVEKSSTIDPNQVSVLNSAKLELGYR